MLLPPCQERGPVCQNFRGRSSFEGLDLTRCEMRVPKMHGKTVESPVIRILLIGGKKTLLCQCFLMKRRAGKCEVDQDLPECRLKGLKLSNLFSDLDRILIWRSDDHGRKHRDTFGLEILMQLRDVLYLQLVIPGTKSFECRPDYVKPHLGNLLNGTYFRLKKWEVQQKSHSIKASH